MTAPATTPLTLSLMPSKPRPGRPGRLALTPTSTYRIDDDVPLPETRGGFRGPQFVYPFRQLRRVGQSFLVPHPKPNLTTADQMKHGRRVGVYAAYAARKIGAGRKFAVRTLPEGVRVGRVK